jgi:hypothetical protein
MLQKVSKRYLDTLCIRSAAMDYVFITRCGENPYQLIARWPLMTSRSGWATGKLNSSSTF